MDYDIKPGKYRHFKGKEYEVIGVATHSESLEPMVVYMQLYGEGGRWWNSFKYKKRPKAYKKRPGFAPFFKMH